MPLFTLDGVVSITDLSEDKIIHAHNICECYNTCHILAYFQLICSHYTYLSVYCILYSTYMYRVVLLASWLLLTSYFISYHVNSNVETTWCQYIHFTYRGIILYFPFCVPFGDCKVLWQSPRSVQKQVRLQMPLSCEDFKQHVIWMTTLVVAPLFCYFHVVI